MSKKNISLALFFLFAYAPLSLPANSWAEIVILFKGSSLVEDTMAGLITIPSMEIQVASWGVAYSSADILVYEPSMGSCSLYEDSLVSNLPDPDGTVTLSDGTRVILRDILGDEPFIVIDTDTGIGTLDVLDHFAATVP